MKCIEGMILSACSSGGIFGINPGFVCKRLRHMRNLNILKDHAIFNIFEIPFRIFSFSSSNIS